MSIILYFLNPNIIFAHVSINEGSLFCFVVTRFIEPGCFRLCVLGVFGKRLTRAWFHDVWSCCAKVLEYWMISSLKIKWELNCSWKFRRNWNVPLDLFERSWWAGSNGIYLVRFGFRMCGRYWVFKVISAGEKFIPKNQVFIGRKNQLSTR